MSKGIKSVGDFDLATAKLITSAGLTIDLKKGSHIVAINLFEDIQRNAISGEIMLEDSAGYVSEAPIIGQEYLQLKIQTSSMKDDTDIINFTENVFVVNSIQNRGEVGNKVSMYLLTFTSSELVKNQRTRVNGSLTGTYSDIVEQMMNKVNCQKKIYIEPTKGIKRIVVPNLSPFKVIEMALQNSTSTLNEKFSPSYMFYETTKAYHYRSLASMYAQPIVQTYTSYTPGSQVLKGGIVDVTKELGNVLDYEIVENSNSLYNFSTGVYGSKLIVHNIYSKTFNEYQYNYFDNFNEEKHITGYHEGKKQYPIFSDVTLEKDGGRSSDFPSRTYLSSMSEGGGDIQNTTEDGTEPFTAPDPQNSLQERASTMNQLDKGLILNILTHGNTVISAGDIVKMDIPLVAAYKTGKKPPNDRFFNGVFLIKRINHEFSFTDKKHKSYLTLVKDSLSEKLEGPDDLYEPKPEKKPIIIKDKEILYPQL